MWAEIAFLATLVFYLTLKPIIFYKANFELFFNFKECFLPCFPQIFYRIWVKNLQ